MYFPGKGDSEKKNKSIVVKLVGVNNTCII